MTEIELKFVLNEDSIRRLKNRLKGLELNESAARTRTLRSVYYDTPEHSLRKAGTALRMRRDGRRWIQTVKARASINGGLLRAQEVENPAPGGRLDLTKIPVLAVRAEVEEAIAGAELAPVCETQMKRVTSVLMLENGARIELAIDSGEIIAGELREPFHEAELELLEGDVDSLYDLTQTLFPDGGLHLSTMSKSERGYMLAATGRAQTEPLPRNACTVPLGAEMTSEIAARDVLRECFEQISANIEVVLFTDAPEGPHQLRIGLRRLRAAFGMFKPVIGHPELMRLNEEAKLVGAQVGALRDLDVVITDIIDPEHEAHPHEQGFNALRSAIEARREAVREELREYLRSERAQSFQIDLARFIETRRWLTPEDFEQTARLAQPIRALSCKALGKRWKSCVKHARGIDHLTIDERHELRKELKKLRYTIEFLGPLYSAKKVARFVKTMKKMQNIFGDLNDLAMAEELLCQNDSPGARNANAQRAVGWVLGARSVKAEAAWAHARGLWRDVTVTGPFWR
ncbi:CYTH and CHAD domain-containing protein [Aliiruegeria sabulilitoris]|uniref:CYTH and CHAD domain-containing protein n=1 Tax=Aliiruegeria sabulilitoris TaxID=1510458 RepID=UPI00082AA37F|nr:CHAD domain-containing protein [Aliiruegeria sabulilitoris]NDR56554.1 CHAD domain-containing protein [Pseudoruegeria sp. M32A2M]